MPLTRYLTRWFVSVDEREAQRLARGDGTSQLEIARDVELLHVQEGWAFWSDGQVTTSTGLSRALRSIRSLRPGAVRLISECFHNTSGPPAIEGGWGALAQVAEVADDDLIEEGRAEGPFDPPRLRRLSVKLADGATRVWWVHTSSSAEGVRFEVSDACEPASTPWPVAAVNGLN